MYKVRVSLGELIDKITILKIKLNTTNEKKKNNIKYEHDLLIEELNKSPVQIDINYIKGLQIINQKLWNVEDKIRLKEFNKNFDDEFIELARSIYKLNDIRFDKKNQINKKYKSEIFEEKIYQKYN
tara:strand:+ start:379 stop:756 length:378 start_codon:yes stop_codon:yes gene_type:complete